MKKWTRAVVVMAVLGVSAAACAKAGAPGVQTGPDGLPLDHEFAAGVVIQGSAESWPVASGAVANPSLANHSLSPLPLHFLLSGDQQAHFTVVEGETSVEIRAAGPSQEEIDRYSGATSRQDLPDLSIIRIGDPKTSCVRQYVNDELAAIRGVCVSEVIIHVPREQLADLYINEIPQDSAAVVRQPISLSALRTGISRLSGASSGNLRKELLSEYLTRRPPSSKHLDDDEIHGLVMLTSSTDERMGMEQLIAVAEGLEPPSLPVVAPKLFVDIRDLDQFSPDSYPDASVILHSMQDDPEKFFPAGVSLDEVSGVEVQEIPSANVVRVNALILSKKAGRFFRKFELALGGNPRQVLGINASSDLALSKCQFTIRVGLVQRKAILEDEKHSIKKIYPLGVGGFDEGVKSASGGRTRLNTPLFHDGTLRESTAYAARTEPEYYQGKPFMPISTQDGTRTPISFHIYQDDTLVRGFISHGCMHLRDRNLQELYTILSRAKRQFIPVNVSYYIEDSEDSPYPFNNHEYTYVVNCAKKGEEPHSCKDPDLEGLTLLRYAEKQPPVSKLDMMGAPRYGVDFAVNGK